MKASENENMTVGKYQGEQPVRFVRLTAMDYENLKCYADVSINCEKSGI